jgi:hypothetical protein
MLIYFVEMASAYPNLYLSISSVGVLYSDFLNCWTFLMILSSYLIQFSCPKLLLFCLGEKIVFHNLEESCYVVKERDLTLSVLYLSFYRAIPPLGNMYGARIEMRVGGRAF